MTLEPLAACFSALNGHCERESWLLLIINLNQELDEAKRDV